jgi:hypothetical protein|tara:strand:+ start:262 stop:705 length:444 start_codon:yes stop_codon:yes gene_type:complete
MTTTTFADYAAGAEARKQIEHNIEEWSEMLCIALEHNYIDEAIRRQKFFATNNGEKEFHEKQIEKIRNGESYKFIMETGRKYHKIVMITDGGNRSVHAFVDKKTGEVYKPASYKAPAKGVRFNLLIIKEREWLFENADWAGSYLYIR